MTAPMDALSATLKVKSQADRRRPAIFRDQHGRRWTTQIDTETMDPCIPMTPTGWSAPLPTLVPAQKYLRTSPAEFGVVMIDYDQWLIDLAESAREYRDHLLQVAQKHFGAAAVRAIEERDDKLRQLAGPGPAAVEYVRAMKAGNKWALGLRRTDGERYPCPPWAVPMLDSLRVQETYDGSNIDLTVDADEFPDVEDDDALAVADRYADAELYADLDDDSPTTEPLKRGRGRPRKEL